MNLFVAVALAIHIIPEPVQVVERAGVFTITPATRIEVVAGNSAVAGNNADAGNTTVTGDRLIAGNALDRANTILFDIARLFASDLSLRVTDPTGRPGNNNADTNNADSNNADSNNAILIELKNDPQIRSAEGYILDVSNQRIRITARAPAGVFYAFESLKQLLPPAGSRDFASAGYPSTSPPGSRNSSSTRSRSPSFPGPRSIFSARPRRIPCVYILDYPRFPYRGMHLDVSRHFFTVSFIKKYLDILAAFKINTFHWHLTDSHGWRLEIKRYPRLTSVGAWRADRKGIPMTIAPPTGRNEPATYGGYYTQEQVKEIIRYAGERFITVIPEIEMPGHCTAALVAYPQYSDLDNKNPLLIPCGYPGDLLHNFCVGYDSTFVFLENILKEVMQLFPSPFIHIGGDEVKPEPWLNCPRCRETMKQHGFTTTRQLQAWFTTRIDSFISAGGRRMIGWDEVLDADLQPGAAIMSWHGDAGGVAGAKKGHDVVMAPYHYTYFDFYQSDPRLEPDITYAPLFLDTVYAFDPQPPGLPTAEKDHILGGEACLWTENIPTPARVEYMLLPRLLALSGDLWSPPQKKDYARFITNVEYQFSRFDAEKIAYARSLYNVNIQPVFDSASRSISVTLTSQAQKYRIRYTMDGNAPTVHSRPYSGPLIIGSNAVLRTALFRADKRMGKVNADTFSLHLATGAPIGVETTAMHTNSVPAASLKSPGTATNTEPVPPAVNANAANTANSVPPAVNVKAANTANSIPPAVNAKAANTANSIPPAVNAKAADTANSIPPAIKAKAANTANSVPPAVNANAANTASSVPPAILPEPTPPEPAQAFKRLVDGIHGTIEPYDGRWVGFHDSLTTLTIDLQKMQTIHFVSLGCMEDQVGDIFLPRKIEVSASADDKNFKPVYSVSNKILPQQQLRHVVTYRQAFAPRQARYVRVVVRNADLFTQPDRNGIFLDEIIIR